MSILRFVVCVSFGDCLRLAKPEGGESWFGCIAMVSVMSAVGGDAWRRLGGWMRGRDQTESEDGRAVRVAYKQDEKNCMGCSKEYCMYMARLEKPVDTGACTLLGLARTSADARGGFLGRRLGAFRRRSYSVVGDGQIGLCSSSGSGGGGGATRLSWTRTGCWRPGMLPLVDETVGFLDGRFS